ncbi:uncharacterized protein LOC142236147 [Haematobia irritans]|uniref:uncharacterized protein LOC142236147 n=1 Tax=Haematobia irritans TaxID=7368 RepID=UPI003F4F7A50
MLSGDEDKSDSTENKEIKETTRMASKFADLNQFNLASGNWQIYLEQMNFFFMPNGIADEKAKKAIFLSSCGGDTYTLLKSIATPVDISSEAFTFKRAIQLLSGHFCPPPNQIIQRFQFYRRDQKNGESVPEFLAALRKLSQHCEFSDLDAVLRDRLVCGLRDESLQKRLLSKDKLTLQIAQEEAIVSEEAQKNLAALKSTFNPTEINRIAKAKESSSKTSVQNCFRCCGKHSPDQCKFKEVDCHFCKKRGHIQKACITKTKMGSKSIRNANTNIKNRINKI